MSQSLYNQKNQVTRTMTEQQFEEIVDAILAGKYSWACVLILQTAGYNPLHYIPYRTYNRLIKDNRLKQQDSQQGKNMTQSSAISRTKATRSLSDKRGKGINDLNYLESIDEKKTEITGGFRIQWSFDWK